MTLAVQDCAGATNSADAIAATGDGYAALLTETAHPTDNALYIQAGRFGRFGARHFLDTVPVTNSSRYLGVAADHDGTVTVGWMHCNVYGWGCAIYGAQDSVRGRFGPRELIAAKSNSPKVNVTGLVADDAVAVQRCRPHQRCTIGVALADRDGRFAPLQAITGDGRLAQLQDDGHGDLLLVYTSHRRVVYAVTKTARAHHVSAPRQLSRPGVEPGSVSSAFGPRGEAIVAWSDSGQTMSAVYDLAQ